MKKAFLVVLLPLLLAFGPYARSNRYTRDQMVQFVREVFADQSDVLVFSNPPRLALIEGFLSRVSLRNSPEYAGKKFDLLSSVPLQNKYNCNLTRDIAIDPAQFNPLKYRLPMASKRKEIFRIDGTQYLLIIEPLK